MEKQADSTPDKVESQSLKDEVLESSTQAESRSKREDLDSFDPIEPPPLDWRSDSSSDACSLKDIEESGSFSMDTPLEDSSDCGACNTSSTPTEVENLTSQEAEGLPNWDVEDLTNRKVQDRTSNTQRMNKGHVPEPLEKNVEKTSQKPAENPQQHDLEHTHLQDLLNQLQLFHPTPPCKDPTPEPEPEPEKSTFSADHATENLSSSCLVPDLSAYQSCTEGNPVSGLLFTVRHQRELLDLLEDPEPQEPQDLQESQEDHPVYQEETTESHTGNISQLPECQTRYITRSGEADEMISVSYGSDVWHSPFQDELMMSGYSEEEVMEQSKFKFSHELASQGADVVGEMLFIVQKLKSIKCSHCVNLCSLFIYQEVEAEAQASFKDGRII